MNGGGGLYSFTELKMLTCFYFNQLDLNFPQKYLCGDISIKITNAGSGKLSL